MGKKAIVIGAGLGGLSAAARLAHSGWNVILLEQDKGPGGKAGSMEIAGFRFDTGPSLVTMPFVMEQTFSDLGEDPGKYLSFRPLEELCSYFYQDGTRMTTYIDKARLFREVDEKTGDTSADLEKYLKHCEKIYNIAAETFMFKSLGEKSTILGKDGLKTMARIGGMDVRRTMHEANASFFSDPKMVQLFDRYGTYNGSNPYKMPGTFNLIQHVEYGIGGYAPHGGIYSIPLALEKLCKKMGVEFRYATKAKKIILECKKVTGVKTEQGEVLEGDIVVSNSDVSNTYRVLIGDGDSKGAQRYEKLEPSSSAMVFYWGINREFSELGVHNIFFSGDYKKEFNQIFDEKRCPEDPTIYINITSKYEPDDAPAGKENWFVMINTPYVSGQNWKKEMGEVRERILRRLSSELGEDVEGLVECEATLSPPEIESRTSSNRGSIYGISSNTRNAAFLRQQNRSKEYPGLYFAGGSAHPGGGMPLAILSGKIAADLANKYQ